MGLDMYLQANRYLAGYDFAPKEKALCHEIIDKLALESAVAELIKQHDSPSVQIDIQIGYWRKANAIHNWFVQNVQDGVDECQETFVRPEQLRELLQTCKDALESRDAERLPSTSGFFFGSTEVNECYWQDIKDTIEIVTRAIKIQNAGWGIQYHSSW